VQSNWNVPLPQTNNVCQKMLHTRGQQILRKFNRRLSKFLLNSFCDINHNLKCIIQNQLSNASICEVTYYKQRRRTIFFASNPTTRAISLSTLQAEELHSSGPKKKKVDMRVVICQFRLFCNSHHIVLHTVNYGVN